MPLFFSNTSAQLLPCSTNRGTAAIIFPMSEPARILPESDDATAEAAGLEAAVSEARADPRTVLHADVRTWLLEIADGKFDVPPPEAR